ncbi:bifunctional glycosyltransferase family 2/GtrA family protein [Arthrobacter sp. ISL-48]|uniref:bifunctional glycosyltransferase family 2/GtrA family protein n=1 Tax=Arthrobacter sp. ISL-48 TaxID=2819110 RepID=UPI001BEA5A13|nr:bifunctional glycosyltransferase family 2/GtrA family protein [Arthrobacter sp. ISL-48]MBT2532992.1 bifunctional glycosyltransferase family 2/GtrA family protein [Arthrobacter sp. ISL-48]
MSSTTTDPGRPQPGPPGSHGLAGQGPIEHFAAIRPERAPVDTSSGTVVLDVAIPVYNEEAALETAVRRLHSYLKASFPHPFVITIADNASTDSSLDIARNLSRELDEVRVTHLDRKGRGLALRTVWLASEAAVVAYMDVDLSTDLAALLPLIAPLMSGHSDLAVGTRLNRNSRVIRGARREFISRSYNLILRGSLGARFSDAQCGFKAIRSDIARAVLPCTVDDSWFFDTELLVIADRAGLRVAEVPVDWTDDPDSSVDVVRTSIDDLKGIVRIGRDMMTGRIPVVELRNALGRKAPESSGALLGQMVRFGVIGAVSTLAYLALFVFMRRVTGAQTANFVALLLTAVANTAANRLFTFGVSGRAGAVRQQFQGLVIFALGLALTSGVLLWLHSGTEPSRGVEVAAVVGANLLATLLKFILFRAWVFKRPGRNIPAPPPSSTGHPGAAATK